jgi:hypothetical protein
MNNLIEIQDLQDIKPHVEAANEPIILVIEAGDEWFYGQVLDGVFGYRMGAETPKIRTIIRDFLKYETTQGRTPIVFLFRGISFPTTMQDQNDSFLENWVVHSTDHVAGKSILSSKRLYSHTCLQGQRISFRPFGREVLGEPPDYFDLINFAAVDGYGPEIVVASKEHGRFCSEMDEYHPGLRFYFKVTSLQKQAGYTPFMGGHAVRGSLSLDRVDHYIITPSDLKERPSWTPRTFTEAANQKFGERISDKADAGDA